MNQMYGELCGDAKGYTAVKKEDIVILTAEGEHGRDGYEVFFVVLPTENQYPEFELRHVEPEVGPTVVTPFSVSIHYKEPWEMRSVDVHDANGTVNVPIQSA